MMLIGGSGRSGTTILCRLFARHPLVSDVPEWRFTTDPDGVVDFWTQSSRGVQSPFHFDQRVKRLAGLLDSVASRSRTEAVLGSARVRRAVAQSLHRNPAPAYARTEASAYSPNFAALAQRLLDRLTDARYDGYWVGMPAGTRNQISFTHQPTEYIRIACAEFLEGVSRDVCAHQGVTRHLEKNTWNTLCWNRTIELLPEARLVHIVRDPRDVVSSYREQPWVPNDAVESARILGTIMEEWEKVRREVPDDTYHEIRLEDLATAPERTLRQLCEFWELPWSDSLLETELSTSSFGRWRQDLSSAEQRAITPYVTPLLERFNYA